MRIEKTTHIPPLTIKLPASKSIANRALIINALCSEKSTLHNVSEARDTVTMNKLLGADIPIWDVLDAGTTMRFLTAFASVTQPRTLTGTDRMKERPIKILVDALIELGAEIEYLEKKGYPPHKVSPIVEQKKNALQVPGDISSQYISALLMIAPVLPNGLSLTLTGHIGSRPYIEMTLAVMKAFGVSASWQDATIQIDHQEYSATTYKIEPDWSAASYWYSFVALSEDAQVTLHDLPDNSIQGDRKIVSYMKQVGVDTKFDDEGAIITKCNHLSEVSFDFADCPDMAQTIAVICAVKGIHCKMTGLESLRIKETDRILALQNELAKLNAQLKELNGHWEIHPSTTIPDNLTFETYHDHRMAMAFAPLATQKTIVIKDPEVVNKSYPGFWDDMRKAGFILSEV